MSTVPAVRLNVRIDPESPIPPFEQLRAQIALQVEAGRIQPGRRLPTVRSLALQLDLSTGTIARAYRELEYAGIVVGRGRQGTFVTQAPPNAYTTIERQRLLADAADAFITSAHQLGFDESDALAAVQQQLE
jgi:DNA-binding transcriptional regulator YhcF (GntR family)